MSVNMRANEDREEILSRSYKAMVVFSFLFIHFCFTYMIIEQQLFNMVK